MKRVGLFTGLMAVLLFGGVFVWYRIDYPYGYRPCALPCLLNILRMFAKEHEGRFPNSSTNAVSALMELYASYPESGEYLSGITIPNGRLLERLQTGKPIDQSMTSWVYWPGFMISDNECLAIVWEGVA